MMCYHFSKTKRIAIVRNYIVEKTTFTPESFPEVACSEVLVAGLDKIEIGYQYTLIIVYDEAINVAAEKEKIAEDPSRSATATCTINVYLPGDTNLDNKANAMDALEILKDVADMTELKALNAVAADVNEDTIIDAKDALAVLKIVAGM